MALLGRLVQWGVPQGRGALHLGFVLQQEFDHVCLAVVARYMQWGVPGFSGCVYIGTVFDQHFSHWYPVFLGAQVQWRQTILKTLAYLQFM